MNLTTTESGFNGVVSGNGNWRASEGIHSYTSPTAQAAVTAPASPFAHVFYNVEMDRPAVIPSVAIQPTRRDKVTPYKPIDEANKRMLHEAFIRITESYDSEGSRVESSNCFDEWKDCMGILARKEGDISMNHRKILGSLISVTHRRDISDFDEDSLKIFQQATYLLRQPRISTKDGKNVIAALLDKGLRISIPMAIDDIGEDKTKELDEMMATLIATSERKE